MVDMRTRNWAAGRKVVNLSPVSSTLPKDGLPAPCERVFFAWSVFAGLLHARAIAFSRTAASRILLARCHLPGRRIVIQQPVAHLFQVLADALQKAPREHFLAGLKPGRQFVRRHDDRPV
jgi:hypothetical protein